MKASVRILVLLTLYLGINEATRCVPKSTFKVDCNTCTCDITGLTYSCENKICAPLKYEDKYEITKTAEGYTILKPKQQPSVNKVGLVTSDRTRKQKRQVKETDNESITFDGKGWGISELAKVNPQEKRIKGHTILRSKQQPKRQEKETDKVGSTFDSQGWRQKETDKDYTTFNDDKKVAIDDWIKRFGESAKETPHEKKLVYQTGTNTRPGSRYNPVDDDDSDDQSDNTFEQSGNGLEDRYNPVDDLDRDDQSGTIEQLGNSIDDFGVYNTWLDR